MGAALPLADEARTYLLPDSASLMGVTQAPLVMRDGRMQGTADVNLRPPRLTDPPMVVALPFISLPTQKTGDPNQDRQSKTIVPI